MGQPKLEWVEDYGFTGGDDTLLPSQYWTAGSDPRCEPEKRLMAAVLEDAVELVVNGPHHGAAERSAAVEEAEDWFASNDRRRPFAFAAICDVLDLDPGQVRQFLLALRARRSHFRRPRLQAGRGRHAVRGLRRASAAQRRRPAEREFAAL